MKAIFVYAIPIILDRYEYSPVRNGRNIDNSLGLGKESKAKYLGGRKKEGGNIPQKHGFL